MSRIIFYFYSSTHYICALSFVMKVTNFVLYPFFFLFNPQKLEFKDTTLRYQIAFIILALKNIDSTDNAKMLQDLNTIANVRNNLYLTHGNEDDPNFFSSTVEQKRSAGTHTVNLLLCKELFEIVYFLISGKVEKVAIS